MAFSRQAQVRITLVSGVVLAVVLITALLQDSGIQFGQPKQATKTADTPKVTPTPTPVPKKDTQPAVEPAPAALAPAEPSEYSFTAASGDSYTSLVRRALQQYSDSHGIAAASFNSFNAEVMLVNMAGAPEIAVGQTIVIKTADVAQAIAASR